MAFSEHSSEKTASLRLQPGDPRDARRSRCAGVLQAVMSTCSIEDTATCMKASHNSGVPYKTSKRSSRARQTILSNTLSLRYMTVILCTHSDEGFRVSSPRRKVTTQRH